jgi:hypothetical protein
MNGVFFFLSVLCVLCQVFHVEAFASRGMISRKFETKTSKLISSAKADESDDEIRERLRIKVRKNLYSDKGVAYAPWVTNQIDEDVRFHNYFDLHNIYIYITYKRIIYCTIITTIIHRLLLKMPCEKKKN